MLNNLGLDFSFLDAVDGTRLSTSQRASVYDSVRNRSSFKRPLSGPEIGCYLSHAAAWKRIAAGEPQAAVVLEDDCAADPKFRDFLLGIEMFDVADVMIKLDGPFGRRRSLHETLSARVNAIDVRELKVITPHTTGYLLGRRAAARLLATRGRFFRPVDNDLKFTWEHGVPILATEPVLVHSHDCAASTSSINASREALKPRNLLLRFSRNAVYQARFQVHRLFYGIKHRPLQLCRRVDGANHNREEKA